MTDGEFFSALDLDAPALNEVNTAVGRGELAAAKKSLAEHIRERETPRWVFDWRDRPSAKEDAPAPSEGEDSDFEKADELCCHIFGYEFIGAGKASIQFGEKIDWGANPTKGEAKTHLWNESLNRHFHFSVLSEAYWEGGNEKYASELVEQWLDWIEQNPRPMESSGNDVPWPYGCYAWQTLTTGIRLENTWPEALYRGLGSPAFTDEAIAAILKSVCEQARHLIRWPTAHNWLTEECMGVFTAGMLFPEFKEAKEWRRIALERLYKQLDDEIYPDGAEYELAGSYGHWVVSNFCKILDLADLNDLHAELPEDYRPKMEKMFNYLLYASMPDGTTPGLNDSGNSDVRELLARGHQLFPHREDFLYVATSRGEGRTPERTSCGFPYSGHYVMRSGWDEDAYYLLFDSGPYGSAHQHEDKLHFVLYAGGRQHVLDAGNYSYDDSRWRRYVLTTPSHNTVLVDGQGQNRRAKPKTCFWPRPWKEPAPPLNDTRWESTSDYDYAVGVYDDGYGSENDTTVTHTRRILFVKSSPEDGPGAVPYFIILDTLTATDEQTHRYESLFHLDTEEAAIDEETNCVRTVNEGASNLRLFPLADDGMEATIVSGQEDPVQGWANHPWRPVPTAIFSKSGKGTVRLLHVLCPVPAGRPVPVVSVEPVPCGPSQEDTDPASATAAKITFSDGRVHTFAQSDEPGRELRFGEFSMTSEAALVQTAPDGAVVKTIRIGEVR